jgi:iron complex outermembrane receptor protein
MLPHSTPRLRLAPLAVAAVGLCAQAQAQAQTQTQTATAVAADPSPEGAPVRSGGVITITGSGQPTGLPATIPTTMESITGVQIERSINATDSEDALKYFPSLLVRKRYIGDYNHAILSSRASGTGNSARSAVYADGILLSNWLGNGVGGLSFPPRWSMVTPEEIERVDVMYGPFSAAYPGNSVGAVVVYVTKMPTAFEVHARAGYTTQPFSLYNTHKTFDAWETSAAVGNRSGDWAWRLDFNHTDSHGQPLTFATRLVSAGVAGSAGTAVNGAVAGLNSAGVPWSIIGTGTEYHTKQDHIKAKLSYDVTPTLRANVVFGLWHNDSTNRPTSYLTDSAGNSVTSGAININGLAYTGSQALGASDFTLNNESLQHTMQALTLKSHTGGTWDWEGDASLYNYGRDSKRANGTGNTLPAAASGGAGTLADGSGTGWVNLALKGTWRPGGKGGEHIVDFGVQDDRWKLRYLTTNLANWISDPGGRQVVGGVSNVAGNVEGDTELQSLYGQDAWSFAPAWKTVLGLRAERWQARNGLTEFTQPAAPAAPVPPIAYASRSESYLSPKAALSFQASDTLVLKASAGRAVRMPTVSELYGATSTANAQYINDPNLRPERSWTTEFTGEKDLGSGLLRATLFTEEVRDSLYSQTTLDPVANRNISRVQNIGRIATQGLETAYSGSDVGIRGLDLNGSVTYAKSIIKENAGFVVNPGDTIGKWQPNIPRWRASVLASYRVDEKLTASLGIRYSGVQYRTLNNADINGFAYQGVSKYTTADLRLHYRVNKQWSAAFGIDNLNNYQFWNFHPYPQRSYSAELRFDL